MVTTGGRSRKGSHLRTGKLGISAVLSGLLQLLVDTSRGRIAVGLRRLSVSVPLQMSILLFGFDGCHSGRVSYVNWSIILSDTYGRAKAVFLEFARVIFDICVGIANSRDRTFQRCSRRDGMEEKWLSPLIHPKMLRTGLQWSDGCHGLLFGVRRGQSITKCRSTYHDRGTHERNARKIVVAQKALPIAASECLNHSTHDGAAKQPKNRRRGPSGVGRLHDSM
jgi:hypothetical protein